MKKIIESILNWVLRLVVGEDLVVLRMRLWGTGALLLAEREEHEATRTRLSEKTDVYWRRIRDDAEWRDHLHHKVARIEQAG